MNKFSKPILEKVETGFESSISFRIYNHQNQNNNDTFWHYHPELELVYVNGGSGKRFVGSHVSHYRNGNLILVGANLPHCGFTESLDKDQQESVIQILPNFLGEDFFNIPEMMSIKALFQRANHGIVFHGDDKRRVGDMIESLAQKSNFDKLLGLLSILKELSKLQKYTLLNAEGFMLESKFEDNNRINIVFNFVRKEFKRPISLEEISDLVNMTKPSFCRYFKKITGKTFVEFVNSYRLTHAAKLLHEAQISIMDVCFESGFNNFSHFNKKFKSFTGKSPSTYRSELKYSVSE